jgi:hypothetical protein
LSTETDHTTSVEECVEANAADGFSNENRTDVVTGDNDNYYYFWGNSLTLPPRVRRCPRAGCLLRLLMTTTRKLTAAVAVLAATAAAMSACSSSAAPDGPEKMVFDTSPTPALTVSVFEPTGSAVNFGLPLYNITGNSVRLVSLHLISPSGPAITGVRFFAFNNRRGGMPLGIQGDLPKTCPEDYTPDRPFTDVVTRPKSESRWIVVAQMTFTRPGTYKFGVVKIAYQTTSGPGWQLLYSAVTIKASPPASIPEYVDPLVCPAKRAARGK